jgi:hypothetical protein
VLAFGASPLAAQQFVTDDAATVGYGACQLEGWHGQVASWILPACEPFRGLELSLGFGAVADNEAARENKFLVQGKYIFRELAPNRFGYGVVLGAGVDPLAQATGRRVEGVYAYLPLTVAAASGRLVLHGNPGWRFEYDAHGHDHAHDGSGGHHELTWALRGDILLTEGFTAIGELFGHDRAPPEYQLGLRTTLLPHRLGADVSYGGHTDRASRGTGWVVGFAWTPPAFRR